MPDNSVDAIITDPPYALGSEVIIRPDGKPDYNKLMDFMDKWEQPNGTFWEEWFKEAFRVLKYGGRVIMFGMDRQCMLNKYYACFAGFQEQQSLYWFFISNFPKSCDLSKMIESKLVCGKANTTEFKNLSGDLMDKIEVGSLEFAKKGEELGYRPNDYNLTSPQILMNFVPTTDLAKKYAGYKYSVSPLKQTNETIMVFQKPYFTGSCLYDTLAMEIGNDKITCGALDIEGNRVPCDINSDKKQDRTMVATKDGFEKGWGMKPQGKTQVLDLNKGRYPSQTFISDWTADILDRQSDVKISKQAVISNKGSIWNSGNENKEMRGHNDIGGISKILHKCNYDKGDYDIYLYCPKVDKEERNRCMEGDYVLVNNVPEDKLKEIESILRNENYEGM